MPDFDIVRESPASTSFRAASVKGQFDLESEHAVERFSGTLPIEDLDWSVGVIYGASGTGKSTIAKELFPDAYFRGFDYSGASVLDDMPGGSDVRTICQTFNSVGFSSPPSWLKPYDVLSNGEKMRVDLARCILSGQELIVFDEFTSVVDRTVAQIGSFALQKAIRRSGMRFIAVSCHSDILDWLEPDWTFCTDTFEFDSGKKKDRRSRSTFATSAVTGPALGSITI